MSSTARCPPLRLPAAPVSLADLPHLCAHDDNMLEEVAGVMKLPNADCKFPSAGSLHGCISKYHGLALLVVWTDTRAGLLNSGVLWAGRRVASHPGAAVDLADLAVTYQV